MGFMLGLELGVITSIKVYKGLELIMVTFSRCRVFGEILLL